MGDLQSNSPAPVAGVRLGVARAGIKYPDRRDLVVIELAEGSSVAGVFTRNAFCAAPVQRAKAHLAAVSPRYFLINTGNANAGTGPRGLADADACCAALAQQAGCAIEVVLPFSTGVIGEPLPVDRIIAGIPAALAALDAQGWTDAAHGIMTTDTRPKIASRQIMVGAKTVVITGIAKGAGMIRPDMATMLSFVATDAVVEPAALQAALRNAADKSFNCITIDGDTSTNDALMLAATGASGVVLSQDDANWPLFTAALDAVCLDLAQAVVRDGEGATKFITVQVEQGRDDDECRRVADAIAHSPLVKTAFFASDPNWGRILAAVGRAGLSDLVIDAVQVHLGDVQIVRDGWRDPTYTEAAGKAVMSRSDITVRVVLGRGEASTTVWTTDFSFDYVKINAEYRT